MDDTNSSSTNKDKKDHRYINALRQSNGTIQDLTSTTMNETL